LHRFYDTEEKSSAKSMRFAPIYGKSSAKSMKNALNYEKKRKIDAKCAGITQKSAKGTENNVMG